MYVVRHGAQGQDLHIPLSGLGAEDGKPDQIVAIGIKDESAILCALIAVGKDVLLKKSSVTPHIAFTLKVCNDASLPFFSKDRNLYRHRQIIF